MEDSQQTIQRLVAERDELRNRLTERDQAEADRRQAERILRLSQFFVDHAADPAFWIDRDGRYLYANEAACGSLGYSQPELLSMSVLDVDPDLSLEAWREHWERIKEAGSITYEGRHRRKGGVIFPVEITANHLEFDGREYHCSFARDITDRKRSQRRSEHLHAVLRALRAIDHAGRGETDRSALLRRVCEILVDCGAYATAWIALINADGVAEAAGDAGMGRLFRPMRRRLGAGDLTPCMIRALAGSAVQVIHTLHEECPDCPLTRVVRDAAAMCVRLRGDGQVLGLLGVSLPPEMAAEDEEQELLEEVAADLAKVLRESAAAAHRRRIEQELEVARRGEDVIGFKIQQMLLLGQVPEDMPGMSVAAVSVPSEYVDGDFYDFYRHGDQCLDVVIGDVMGKGVPAALLAAATKSLVQKAVSALGAAAQVPGPPEPRRIVQRLHEQITPRLINLESFVTLCYGRIDLRNRRLELVDCGHTRTIHYRRRTGRCRLLHGDNFFLGVIEDCQYSQISVPLAAGDLLLFYSDGVVEARRADGELFGSDRLVELVRQFAPDGADRVVEEVRREVMAFCGAEAPADDLTCVAVQVRHVAAEPLARRTLQISSDPRELPRVREFVGAVCTELAEGRMDEEGVIYLQMAANEAVNNITRHAYAGRTDQPVELEGLVFEDRVTVRLRHRGTPLDEEQPIRDAPNPLAGEGLGLYVIDRASDEASYSRSAEAGGCVSLTRMFRMEGPGREGNGNTF